jgi:hypothetical protein
MNHQEADGMKQDMTLTNSKDTKINLPISQIPAPLPQKEKLDKETVQILVDDRVATGG